ncbi:hypothetical protein AAHE18_03G137100 [Arachis hypogaea]
MSLTPFEDTKRAKHVATKFRPLRFEPFFVFFIMFQTQLKGPRNGSYNHQHCGDKPMNPVKHYMIFHLQFLLSPSVANQTHLFVLVGVTFSIDLIRSSILIIAFTLVATFLLIYFSN